MCADQGHGSLCGLLPPSADDPQAGVVSGQLSHRLANPPTVEAVAQGERLLFEEVRFISRQGMLRKDEEGWCRWNAGARTPVGLLRMALQRMKWTEVSPFVWKQGTTQLDLKGAGI